MTDSRLTLMRGDITTLEVDAIVNAANSTLLGGGGVDGAIHRAAGPELLQECRTLNGCPTGEARITRGYRLKARYVIHTVGPRWHGGQHQEEAKLRNCYRNSLELAMRIGVQTIAFPAISTGIYGYPFQAAANISIGEVLSFLEKHHEINQVILVYFSEGDLSSAQALLANWK